MTTTSRFVVVLFTACLLGLWAGIAGADDSSRALQALNEQLREAAWDGDTALVEELLNKGAQIDSSGIYGDTALTKALRCGRGDTARLLLSKGADVGVRLKDGSTTLMWAALSGNVEFVKLILDKGIDVNAESEDGSTALKWAAIMEYPDVVSLLKSRGAKTTLSIAAMLGDKDEVLRLIEAGADANARDKQSWTPLMNAAQRGHTEVVRLLIEKSVDVKVQRDDGSTAFMDAVCSGSMDMIKLFIERGVDVNERRPLHRFDRRSELAIGRPDNLTNSPLMQTVFWGQYNLVRLLVNNGADVNQTKVLVLAVNNGDPEILKILLDKGTTFEMRRYDSSINSILKKAEILKNEETTANTGILTNKEIIEKTLKIENKDRDKEIRALLKSYGFEE